MFILKHGLNISSSNAMHSSLLSPSVTLAFAFLIARVTPVPAGFPTQDTYDGNLFASNFLLDDAPSIFTGSGIGSEIETAPEGQSSEPIAFAPANDLLIQSKPDDVAGTDMTAGMDQSWDTSGGAIDTNLFWDTGTGIGANGEEYLNSYNNNNNNFDLLASASLEPYTSPEISPGGYDDSKFDPTSICSMGKFSEAACCGYPISTDRYIPDCLPSEFPPFTTRLLISQIKNSTLHFTSRNLCSPPSPHRCLFILPHPQKLRLFYLFCPLSHSFFYCSL